jgi:hypothetical protein
VIFLGWTRLHATWIKPEVVATKKCTGYLHYRFMTTGSRFLWSPCCSYMCFFEFLCVPANCLSVYGFWPDITHVIVLTFKEIKHLSDYRTVGLSDRRTIGLSDCRIIGRTPAEKLRSILHVHTCTVKPVLRGHFCNKLKWPYKICDILKEVKFIWNFLWQDKKRMTI